MQTKNVAVLAPELVLSCSVLQDRTQDKGKNRLYRCVLKQTKKRDRRTKIEEPTIAMPVCMV